MVFSCFLLTSPHPLPQVERTLSGEAQSKEDQRSLQELEESSNGVHHVEGEFIVYVVCFLFFKKCVLFISLFLSLFCVFSLKKVFGEVF